MNEPLFLSGADIAALLRRVGIDSYMDSLIARLEGALRDYDEETYKVPPRDGFQYETPFTGLVEWMPLMHTGESVLMKLVGYHPDNPLVHSLPTILSSFFSFDVRTGRMMALADGTLLTSLRTGAASAVASKILAHPESSVIGLIGAGAQAVSQLHALSRVFPLKRALVFDENLSVSATFAKRVAPLQIGGLEVEVTNRACILEECDLLCTATSVEKGAGPVFDGNSQLKSGLHINAIGSDLPGKIEVPLSVLQRSFVCPDFLAQALVEGECQQLGPDGANNELHELVKSPSDFTRMRKQISVFDSTGFALEDYVALEHAVEQAKLLGIGTPLKHEQMPDDPYNPYEALFPAVERCAEENFAAICG